MISEKISTNCIFIEIPIEIPIEIHRNPVDWSWFILEEIAQEAFRWSLTLVSKILAPGLHVQRLDSGCCFGRWGSWGRPTVAVAIFRNFTGAQIYLFITDQLTRSCDSGRDLGYLGLHKVTEVTISRWFSHAPREPLAWFQGQAMWRIVGSRLRGIRGLTMKEGILISSKWFSQIKNHQVYHYIILYPSHIHVVFSWGQFNHCVSCCFSVVFLHPEGENYPGGIHHRDEGEQHMKDGQHSFGKWSFIVDVHHHHHNNYN